MTISSPWSWKRMLSATLALVFPFLVHAQGGSCDSQGEGSEALRACKKFSCQAKQACNGAAGAASQKNDIDASQVAGRYSGTTQVANSSYDLSALGSRSAGSLGQASGYCRKLAEGSGAKSCQSMCDPKKITQNDSRAQKERKEMERERQSCLAAINQTAESLDQGKKDNEDAAKDAQKTGDQAKSDGGKGGGGEQNKGQGDQNGGSPQSNNQPEQKQNDPTQQNCNGPNAASLAACSSKLESECTGSKMNTDPRCKTFADRYCKPGFSSASESGDLKRGSGASSDFCRENLASGFCSSPGRSGCPSCSGTASSIATASGTRLAQLCGACASGADLDPIFSDPQVAKACKSVANAGLGNGQAFSTSSVGRGSGGAVSGGGQGGGGSSGGMGASDGSASMGSEGHSSEVAGSQLKTDIGGDDGGGGGGGYSYGGSGGSDGSGDMTNEAHGANGNSRGSRGLASDGNYSPASDVMQSVGPNVFSIQSTVIQNRCESGRLLHCEKGKR